MEQQNLNVGTKVNHPNFGEGVIREMTLYQVTVFFKEHGDKTLDADSSLEVVEEGYGPGTRISPYEIEMALTSALEKYADITLPVELGNKWKGGKLIFEPKDPEQKEKEVPIETFFHKIVMVRDRLRVLEQNINSHKGLTDEEKVHLQQYITKAYGSLTTFNVLFKNQEDSFKSG